ncbi:MAG: bactofilin family protein [Spirochaetia bacterium]
MAEIRIKDIDEQEIDTILAEDIDFEGYLTFKKPLMIKGKFKGEIKSTSSLYIGEKAFVEAATEAAVVSSKGTHKGNIVGHARVELFSTAQVEGDVSTPDFVVESGCKFNGYCNMGAPRKQAAQTAAPQSAAGQSAPQSTGAAPSAPKPAPPAAPQTAAPHAAPQQQGAPLAQQTPQGQQHGPQQNQQHGQQTNQQQNQQKPGAPSTGSGGLQK